MYPHTASISMLAYTFINGYQPSFIIFGGAVRLKTHQPFASLPLTLTAAAAV